MIVFNNNFNFCCILLIISVMVVLPKELEAQNVDDEIVFSYSKFVKSLENKKIDSFIINERIYNNLDIDLYDLSKIDLSNDIITDSIGNKYLGWLGEYVLLYANDSDSLFALSVYLKSKYNLKNSIFDQLLRQCIILDDTFVRAYFLLAELRFKKGGYVEDGYFLISQLKLLIPLNKEVERIYDYFYNRIKAPPLEIINFKEYLFNDYYYLIED